MKIKNIINKGLSSIGLSEVNQTFLFLLQHPQWLKVLMPLKAILRASFTGINPIKDVKLCMIKPFPVNDEDLKICERIKVSFQESISQFSPSEKSFIWRDDTKRSMLISALEKPDVTLLAKLMTDFYKQDFSWGITKYNEIFKLTRKKIASRIWVLKFLDDLISLAEYLGVCPAETPEQGDIGYAFHQPIDRIIENINKSFGVSMEMPLYGAPNGYKIKNKFYTFEATESIYVTHRIESYVDLFLKPKPYQFVEIGAGYGASCYFILKHFKQRIKNYMIIDLPTTNILQAYYLCKVFGPENVQMYGEPFNNQQISIMPSFIIKDLPDFQADIILNENSMPEIPLHSVEEYSRWIDEVLSGFFYSFNQEARIWNTNIDQVYVPDIFQKCKNIKRVLRSPTWVRRGYVEELYLKS